MRGYRLNQTPEYRHCYQRALPTEIHHGHRHRVRGAGKMQYADTAVFCRRRGSGSR